MQHVAEGGPVGVMLHHGVMDGADMERAGELLSLLAGHANVRARRMADTPFLRVSSEAPR
jgi:hypothetical protein